MRWIFKYSGKIVALSCLFLVMGSYAQEQSINLEDNITYNSYMDANNIYVQLSTADQPTMFAMLHSGFHVYFDVKGKKKKKVSVQYPLEMEAPQRGQGGNKRGEGNRAEGGGEDPKEPNMLALLEAMPKKANYISLDYEEEFRLDLNKLGIGISFSYNEEAKSLAYELKMPKQNIAKEGTDFSKLSIGVVTPKMERDTENSGSNISFGSGGRGGGFRGGGQGGPPQRDQRPEKVTIDFWFKADLTD